MGTEGGKKLSELRVCDLKLELEKRSLETTGVKMELAKRLQEVSLLIEIYNFIQDVILNFRFCHYVVKKIRFQFYQRL